MIDVPILFLHAEDDWVVPYRQYDFPLKTVYTYNLRHWKKSNVKCQAWKNSLRGSNRASPYLMARGENLLFVKSNLSKGGVARILWEQRLCPQPHLQSSRAARNTQVHKFYHESGLLCLPNILPTYH